jgi:N-acetylglucosaminyldiphosphoundecaprenol N-acetyl-beta-D-mannosaminyltransferase
VDTQTDRILLLTVPLDIVTPEELPDVVNRILRDDKKPGAQAGKNSHTIILLSLWDLLRARRNSEYRDYVFKADLVIPISKSLVSGAKFLTGKKPFRYMPFHFFVSLLTILERREYPLYLLGGGLRVLRRAEKNIHATFPRLNIIGRCPAAIKKQVEPAIREAIRKTSPSLLLAGSGIRGGELWLSRNSYSLNAGLRVWCSDLFEVFAEKKRRPPDAVFNSGLESLFYCFRNPFKFFRIFLYLYYKLLLIICKLFRRY